MDDPSKPYSQQQPEQFKAVSQKMQSAVNNSHDQMAQAVKLESEYAAQKDSCLFETNDIQKQMLESSKTDRKLNVISLVFTIIGATGSLIAALTGIILLLR